MGGDAELLGVAGDDEFELFDGVELQPRGNAEAVAQGRRQQAQPGGGAHQSEGLQLDPDGARGGAFADHEVQLEILERRIQHLFDHRVQAVDLVDE